MKYCTKCGTQMNDDDVFCPKCGNKVGSSKVKKSNENVDEHFISESLVSYFDGANALELKKYAIEQIIEKIDTELTKAKDSFVNYTLWSQSNVNRINELKKKINNYKEASFVKEVARETQFKGYSFSSFIDVDVYLKVLLVCCVIVVIGGFALGNSTSPAVYSFFSLLNRMGMLGGVFAALVFITVTPLIILYIVYLFSLARRKSSVDSQNRKTSANVEQRNAQKEAEHNKREAEKKAKFIEDSNKEIERLSAEISDYNIELAYLNSAVFPELEDQMKQAKEALAKQEEALEKYYSLEIIYPKYRALIPVATMYEYLKSGRVNRLTSTEGAYNVYEFELRQDKIIGQLDDLIDLNKQMLNAQYSLIQAVNSVRSEVGRLTKNITQISEENSRTKEQIVSGIKKIAKSNEMTKYYAKVTSDNVSYLRFIEQRKNDYYRYTRYY